jgi:hypothetical protein
MTKHYHSVVTFVSLFVWTGVAIAQTSSRASLGGEVSSDFKNLANNVTDDAIDLATSPLHLGETSEIVRRRGSVSSWAVPRRCGAGLFPSIRPCAATSGACHRATPICCRT